MRKLSFMLKVIKGCYVLLGLSLFLQGCLTNYYEEYYVDTESGTHIQSIQEDTPIELRLVTTEEDVIELIENGYISVGYSSFAAPYTPLSLAVDTAKEHGATLVLLDIQYKETKQYTSVMFLPSLSTSYTYGTVGVWNSSASHCTVTYSETTTTTTVNAVPVQKNLNIYSHDAMFFKKVDTSKLYGVQWFIPKRLPTESIDAPIQVRVLAVLHGSEAEKAGIRRGQVVKSVNGVQIKTRQDIAPFVDDCGLIKDVEVEDVK